MQRRKTVSGERGNAAVVVVVLLIVVAVAGLVGWRLYARHQNAATNTTAASTSSANQPLGTGSDNASLDNDLNNLGSSLNGGTQDIQAGAAATNDQQISVPTE